MSPMNNRRMTPTQEPGVLDFAPGAAAAYSLRNLSLSYSGPVVTVRRSTDDAEAEFTASEVSHGTLAAWCSGGDGFVKTWHDQSGNGNDAGQSTAANQPKIVNSGSIITKNGRPLISFDGTTFLSAASALTMQSGVAFCVFDATGGQFRVSQANPANNSAFISLDVTTVIPSYARVLEVTASGTNIAVGTLAKVADNNVSLVAYSSDGTSWSMRTNGATEALSVTSGANTGAWFGDYQFPFEIQRLNRAATIVSASDNLEIIIYPTDMTALRTRIEGNLAWYY